MSSQKNNICAHNALEHISLIKRQTELEVVFQDCSTNNKLGVRRVHTYSVSEPGLKGLLLSAYHYPKGEEGERLTVDITSKITKKHWRAACR